MTPRPTKQHILDATINAISKYGVQSLTTRLIAQEAGVNNAALHYYYGTKENLLAEALAHTLAHSLDDIGVIMTGAGTPAERLTTVFAYLLEGALRYPNLIRAHLDAPLMKGDGSSPFVGLVDALINLICDQLGGQTLGADQRLALLVTLHAAFSSILVAGLMPSRPDGHNVLEMRDPGTRAAFIACLVENSLQRAGIE